MLLKFTHREEELATRAPLMHGAAVRLVRAAVLFALTAAGGFVESAIARPATQKIIVCDFRGCSDRPMQNEPRRRVRRAIRAVDANGNDGTVIGSRPAGCPYAYCGCGLRKYLGLADKRLNLAWNWARLFPRTAPRPGTAAVRRGHVMLLVRHVSGSDWIVRDYNGGRHLSYIHQRSVRGYVFVDPGARAESL